MQAEAMKLPPLCFTRKLVCCCGFCFPHLPITLVEVLFGSRGYAARLQLWSPESYCYRVCNPFINNLYISDISALWSGLYVGLSSLTSNTLFTHTNPRAQSDSTPSELLNKQSINPTIHTLGKKAHSHVAQCLFNDLMKNAWVRAKGVILLINACRCKYKEVNG